MYHNSVVKAREAVLMEDLFRMRESLDKFFADKGEYPPSLGALVESRYIRALPVDPFTESADTWQSDPDDDGGVFDVHSGSDLTGRNGVPYSEW
jgi:general secretion pathway protein G